MNVVKGVLSIPLRVVDFRERSRILRSRRHLAAQKRENSIVISITIQLERVSWAVASVLKQIVLMDAKHG